MIIKLQISQDQWTIIKHLSSRHGTTWQEYVKSLIDDEGKRYRIEQTGIKCNKCHKIVLYDNHYRSFIHECYKT